MFGLGFLVGLTVGSIGGLLTYLFIAGAAQRRRDFDDRARRAGAV